MNPPQSYPRLEHKYAVLFFAAALAASLCLLTGCAAIAPGSDPVVVRAEQLQTVANASFSLVVRLDNADRPFWRTNAPAFHAFVEHLREPVQMPAPATAPSALLPGAQLLEGRATLPRFIAVQWNLDTAKLEYKAIKSAGSSNALAAAMLTVQVLTQQSSAWLSVLTNKPTH